MRQRTVARRPILLIVAALASAFAVAGVMLGSGPARGSTPQPVSVAGDAARPLAASRPGPTTPQPPSPTTTPSDGEEGFACPAGEPSASPAGYAPATLRLSEETVTITFDIKVDAKYKVTMTDPAYDKPWASTDLKWTVKGDEIVPSCIKLFFDSRTVTEIVSVSIKCDGCSYGARITKLTKSDKKDDDDIPFTRWPFSIAPYEPNVTYNVTVKVKITKSP